MELAAAVLGGLVLSALLCLAVPRRRFAVVLALFSAVWLPVNNRRLEGSTLWVISPGHGVTEADLISFGGFLLAAATVLRWSHAQLRSGRDASAGRHPPAEHRPLRTLTRSATGPMVGLATLAGCAIAATWLLGTP